MIEHGMAVQYGSPDFFPQTWALYVCRCGRLECEHGRHVSELPPGWHQMELEEREIAVCPTCWSRFDREAAPAAQ
jgi:hypothetical protein